MLSYTSVDTQKNFSLLFLSTQAVYCRAVPTHYEEILTCWLRPKMLYSSRPAIMGLTTRAVVLAATAATWEVWVPPTVSLRS